MTEINGHEGFNGTGGPMPQQSPLSSQPMVAAPTEGTYFLTWLVFYIATTLASLLLGAAIGAVIGLILGAAGMDLNTIQIVCGFFGWLLGTAISYLMFRWLVGKMIVAKMKS